MDAIDENLHLEGVDFDNSVTRHLTSPKFIAGETCIRMFFIRFELFRNSFDQNWNDALSINILCNFVCDKTLLVIFNFPPEVQNSYERTKRYMITYFSSGESHEMLWNKLNCSRQKLSQSVIEYFNELLGLNKVLQVTRPILKNIFVTGLRPEIRKYLGLNMYENRTLQQVYYLAKKFEAVDNSEIFKKPKVYNTEVGKQSFNDSPNGRMSEEYWNSENEKYASNNWEPEYFDENQREISTFDDNTFINEFVPVQSQYETGNFNNFTDSNCDNVRNEWYYPRKRSSNYTEHSPRCAMVQVKNEGSDFEYREMKKRNNMSGNLSIQNNKNRSYGKKYKSFRSVDRRRYRMRKKCNNNVFLNKETKGLSDQNTIVQQNSEIRNLINAPYVNVITTKDDNLGRESRDKGIPMAGVLVENVDLEPNMVTQTFINGKVEKGSTINIEGNWFIRNKLLIVFEKQAVAPTVSGYPCEISNLNRFNVKLGKGTEIANISYSQKNLQNDFIKNGKTENFTPEIQDKIDSQMGDSLSASDNKDTMGKADFSDRTWAHFGGVSMGKKWDENMLESMKRKDGKHSGIIQRREENKTGINHDSFISPKKDKNERVGIGSRSKLAHREKVFSEIKLFFKFKQQEVYITDLKREIEDIKLKCFIDLEDVNLKFRNLEFEFWNMNNLLNSASNISENLYVNNIPEELVDTQNYLDQGVKSNDGNICIDSEYRDSREKYPGKIERYGNVENLDFNKLIQPANRVSLNGSQIFLPPVPNLNETSDELGQCIVNVCQIREFLKKVSCERKNYVDNILHSYS